MKKIAAVVVTYNRFSLLQKTVNALRNQTRRIDQIIVVNNGSTDNTKDWLDAQADLFVIHQENVGGSGGFYRGMREAYETGYDWIWCMDDDVYPKSNCLEELLNAKSGKRGILCPRRVIEDKPFCGECVKINLSSLIKPFHEELTPLSYYNKQTPFEIMGMAFEGPLISKDVVNSIGYPNKELFILFDDTEYSIRAINSGYSVVLVPTAVLDKENLVQSKTKIEIAKASSWKLFYEIRNNSYIHRVYGKNWFVKVIKPIFLLIKYDMIYLFNIFNDKYKLSDFISWQKAYIDGQRGRLGKK